MVDYIGELEAAILNLHGCTAKHIETVSIIETFQGKTVWDGEVEVFELHGHPQAKKAYAWGHATGKNDQARRYVAVLDLPPVDSAQSAVRAAIMQEVKDARGKA